MLKTLLIRFFSMAPLLLLLNACGPRMMLVEEPLVWREVQPTATPQPVIQKKHSKIVLDPGHGAKDPGAHSDKNHYQEKQLALSTARLVRRYLEQMGYQIIMTRDEDVFVELKERAEVANRHSADLFVSIHCNYCSTPDVHGIEVYYYKDDKNPSSKRLVASKRLGEEVLAKVIKHTGASSKGVKTANFAVVRETKMPAILIETGFLSNPAEREKLKDPQYRCYLAWGIARGIDAYLTQLK